MPTWSVVVAIVVGVVGPFLTYKAATWASSGKISTTDAETLWAEQRSMKDEYREQARASQADNTVLRGEVADLRSVAAGMREHIVEVERRSNESLALAEAANLRTAQCEQREALLMNRLDELLRRGD